MRRYGCGRWSELDEFNERRGRCWINTGPTVACIDGYMLYTALLLALLLAAIAACQPKPPQDSASVQGTAAPDRFAPERARMVQEHIEARGVRDPRVLAAMRRVPRHEFVPPALREVAYRDSPLPIGREQTISQPYIVAYMTEAAQIEPGDKVLEIGTGSGYQAAILAELAREVYTIELIPELAATAKAALDKLGYTNVRTRTGDGYAGWREAAPFDAILVTAAPDHVPPALVEQLAVGARMIIPVGRGEQEMRVITRTAAGVTEESTISVMFVPLVRPSPPVP